MKFKNPFKRKTDPKLEEVFEARKRASENKMAMAKKIIDMVDNLKIERRCAVTEYSGPDRRQAHA